MSTVGFVAAMEQIGLADQSVAAAWQAHVTIGSLPLYLFGTDDAARALAPTARRGPCARRVRAHRARRRLRRPRHPHTSRTARRRLVDQRAQDVHLQRRHRHVVRRDAAGAHASDDDGEAPTVRELRRPEGHARASRWARRCAASAGGASTLASCTSTTCGCPTTTSSATPTWGSASSCSTLEVGRISIAALSLSLTQAVLDMATDYAHQRVQFGQPIVELPGDPVQAGRHRHRARGGALAHVPRRRAARRRTAVPQGGVDGQAQGQPPRGRRPRRRRCRSTAGSATCSSPPSPASTATPRCSRSARAPTRSSTS